MTMCEICTLQCAQIFMFVLTETKTVCLKMVYVERNVQTICLGLSFDLKVK